MGQARQTVERRQLGLTLRRLRKEAGKSQQEAANAIGKVRSRIVDLEDGRSATPEDDLIKLLDCYGVSDERRETVLSLGAEARKRQRRRTYTDLLPGAFQRFADLEASATEISSYESGIIPGLLQSPGYVRAVIEECDGVWWDATTDAELEQRIAFRLDRQERSLTPTGQRSFRFVLTEDSLRAVVADAEVMHEQLQHLAALVDTRDDLVVQVLKQDASRNPARGGGFTVFSFSDRGTPVGFFTAVFGPSTYHSDEADTATMLHGFSELQNLALDRDKSRALIDKISKGG
ncbi:helix-turn-helix domain-containing protein [Saccharopolyspora shandongensis]|uniref:helix-turn-helix domain-containing protein n=1 Tax=Saccharopolyspora shandongensis TaxID=418495 RepID=UPI0033C40020